MEALRKRILREIFIAPSVVLPVVGGASAWLLSWAGGGNDWLNLAGLVGVLGGVGWFATRFIFQLDGISEKAMQDLAEEALQKEEKHLNELQKRLANDRDPRTEQYLILLRENRTELERIARTPGIELRSLEIVKQARQLFWAASDQLDQSMKMYELAQKLTGSEKQGVLAQRERCLEEARESSEHLRDAIATFRQFADKTLERDMDTLQLELAESIRAANYDRIVEEKRKRLNQYVDAVGAMIAQEENKKAKLTQLTEEVQKLEKLKAGAAARAKQLVDKYNGDVTAVKNDPEYAKCQAAFKDFSSTLAEKQQRALELEEDMKQLVGNVTNHKNQIQSLMRELDKLKEEKHDAVADVLSAKEEKQIADMVNGISNDKTAADLQRLRELRQKASASARVSREVAGLDSKRAESEFLEYAQTVASDDEFDALIGLSKDQKANDAPARDTKIPEA